LFSDTLDLRKLSSDSYAFDMDKLNWYGGYYIRSADIIRITDLALPYLKEKGLIAGNLTEGEFKHLSDVVHVIRQNVSSISQIAGRAVSFFQDNISYNDDDLLLFQKEKQRNILESVVTVLAGFEKDINSETFDTFCESVFQMTPVRGKEFHDTLRLALTGSVYGPVLQDTMRLLGKEKTIKRIKDILERDVRSIHI